MSVFEDIKSKLSKVQDEKQRSLLDDKRAALLSNPAYRRGGKIVSHDFCFIKDIFVQEIEDDGKYITISDANSSYLQTKGGVRTGVKELRSAGAAKYGFYCETEFSNRVAILNTLEALITCFSFASREVLKPFLGEDGQKNLDELVKVFLESEKIDDETQKDTIYSLLDLETKSAVVKKVLSDICSHKDMQTSRKELEGILNASQKTDSSFKSSPFSDFRDDLKSDKVSDGEILFMSSSEERVRTLLKDGYITPYQSSEMIITMENKDLIRQKRFYKGKQEVDPRNCFAESMFWDENGVCVCGGESFAYFCKQNGISFSGKGLDRNYAFVRDPKALVALFNFATPKAAELFVGEGGDEKLNSLVSSFVYAEADEKIKDSEIEKVIAFRDTLRDICKGKEKYFSQISEEEREMEELMPEFPLEEEVQEQQ